MWPDRISNPGPLIYESGALPIALRGPAEIMSQRAVKPETPSNQYLEVVGVPHRSFTKFSCNGQGPVSGANLYADRSLVMYL